MIVKHMWEGGPLREWSEKRENTNQLSLASGGFGGSYVCDEYGGEFPRFDGFGCILDHIVIVSMGFLGFGFTVTPTLGYRILCFRL